jgi:hypothetical protein
LWRRTQLVVDVASAHIGMLAIPIC